MALGQAVVLGVGFIFAGIYLYGVALDKRQQQERREYLEEQIEELKREIQRIDS